MPTCPVCNEAVDADDSAFNHHVNSHFGSEPPVSADKATNDVVASCPICDFPFIGVPEAQQQTHINTCLDGGANSGETNQSSGTTHGDVVDDGWVEIGWDGPAKPGGWHHWVNKKTDRGDKWWSSTSTSSPSSSAVKLVNGSTSSGKGDTLDIPGNFSPDLIPIIHRLLAASSDRNITRHAVLARETTLIRGVWGFDMGWGCGYRNALMAISALIAARPEYSIIFDKAQNGSDPGVRRIQGWIEEAWSEGFDEQGRDHFKGRLLGTRKWIGTADIYAMFVYKGIPCQLYDFPKPEGGRGAPKTAHLALQQWVREYFADDSGAHKGQGAGGNAFDVMMRKKENGMGRGEPIRLSNQLPLILQHSGHSRSIVGYEENSQGHINLLLFDPGRGMSKDIRNAGIEHHFERPKQRPTRSNEQFPSSSDIPRTSTSTEPADIPSAEALKARPSITSLSSHPRRSSSHMSTHESLHFEPPYTNGDSEFVNAPVPTAQSPDSEDDFEMLDERPDNHIDWNRGVEATEDPVPPEQVREDEEMDDRGWVKKRVDKALGKVPDKAFWEDNPSGLYKALGYFRVNLSKLSSHTEYQVLAFTNGPLLTATEKERRKKITSTVIR